MNRRTWSTPTTAEEARRRAGGRNRYNVARRARAALRRVRLADLLEREEIDWTRRGAQAALARRLGVSRNTVGSDLRVLADARALTVDEAHRAALVNVVRGCQ